MKIQYKLGLMAMGLLAFTSCEKHDLIADNMAIGERVPTVYWTVGSTACKAGEAFTFEGKYYTEDGHQPDHSEVWYSVIREDVMSAQAKLVSSLSYTLQTTVTDTIRAMQCIATYPHSLATWNGHEYVLADKCPTSSTLAPVSWQNKSGEWTADTQEKFDLYFPDNFEETFLADVKTKTLASESVLRDVYCTYTGFTNHVVDSINGVYGTNLPIDFGDSEGKTKSEQWYRITDSDTDADKTAAIKGYYYVNESGADVQISAEETWTDNAGNIVYYIDPVMESVTDEDGNEVLNVVSYKNKYFCYPVYEAAYWLYCRYDNDSGSIVTTVLDNYIPAFDAMVAMITFPKWIKGTAAEGYVATFKRNHKLSTVLKVVDTEGNVGMYTTPYEITLN